MTENKRFTILYETEENPMEWDLIDNQEDCLIVTGNGTAICELLNELSEENRKLKEACKKYGIELKDIPEILDWADSILQCEYDSSLSEWND